MEPFKNLLGAPAAQKIARAVFRAHPNFSKARFMRGLAGELEPLELKARMQLLCQRLGEQLEPSPSSFPILVGSLRSSDEDMVGLAGFLVWPLTQFVAEHGLDDFEASLPALKEMTKVFTSEFAVRPFFLKDEKRLLRTFLKWTADSNEHVRRLVSEGSRPLLPWGQKLPRFLAHPQLTWPLLEALKDDPSRYVQKSVANHMNDLSKQHGDWLVAKLAAWPNAWVARHAVRSLVKQGHPGALKILGVGSLRPQVSALRLKTPVLRVGEVLEASLKLHNPTHKPLKVIVDVAIDFLKARGQHAEKVFKGLSLTLAAGETRPLLLRTPLRQVSTRKYHLGTHHWSLILNGQRLPKKKFQLLGAAAPVKQS